MKNGRQEIWFCPIDKAPPVELSHEERRRAHHMLPENKAREFIASRKWLRWLSSQYLGLAPGHELEIRLQENGKPYAIDFPALEFNISHSGNLVAIAFSRQPVGIDIEKIRRLPDWAQIAEGLLSEDIIRRIKRLSPRNQYQSFLSEFTAREAYGKATGDGLSGTPGAEATRPVYGAQDITIAGPATIQLSGVAMEINRFGIPIHLPCPAGYVGHVCIMTPA